MIPEKTKKALKITLDVVAYILFAIAVLLMVFVFASRKKGYTAFGKTALVAVQTDSMAGSNPDSFDQGALLTVKLLSSEEKKNLKIGDIITFYDDDIVKDKRVINSHRIVEVNENFGNYTFRTKGDNAPGEDSSFRTMDEVIGVVTKHVDGLGKVSLFLKSSTGILVCVVIPSILLLGYCVYDLVKIVLAQKKENGKSEKDKLKEELLAELIAEGKIPAPQAAAAEGKEQVSDKGETAPDAPEQNAQPSSDQTTTVQAEPAENEKEE